MEHCWVYNALVTDHSDAIGLVAYSLYKRDKSKLAQDLASNGSNSEHINEQLRIFHEQALSTRIETYRDQGQRFLDTFVEEYVSDAKSALEKKQISLEREIEILKKEKAKSKKDAVTDFVKKAKLTHLQKEPWYFKLWCWLISGFPALLSSFILMIFAYGIMVFFSSPEQRVKFVSDFVTKITSSAIDPNEK